MESAWIDKLERPLAFVLGGGASLGAVQLGMLRAVMERGLRPDFLIGTSVGALNAVYLARSFDLERLDELEAIWSELETGEIFPRRGWRSLLSVATGRTVPALASPRGVRDLLRRHAPTRYEELEIPVAVVAADLLAGEKVVFHEGDLHEHVLASTAIPGVFPPVEVDGRTLVDGGIVANVPVLPARTFGAESMVVLDPGYPCDMEHAPTSGIGYAMHVVTLLLRHQAHGALHFLGDDTTVVYPPPPCPISVPPHRFDRTRELIGKGRRRTSEFLDELEVERNGVYGHPHFHPPN